LPPWENGWLWEKDFTPLPYKWRDAHAAAYEKAAAPGDAKAQTNLGVLYQNGQGMPED